MWVIEVALILACATTSAGFLDDMEGYDKNKRPHFGRAVADGCAFYIEVYKIGPVSEASMSMTTDIYLRQNWSDPRLARAANDVLDHSTSNRSYFSLAGEDAANVWKPKIYFTDAISEKTPSEVSVAQFLQVYRDGWLYSSKRVVLTTRCPLSLKFFPMDVQVCSICFESYELDDSEQFIFWENDVLFTDISAESTATFHINQRAKHTSRTTFWPSINANYTTLCMEIRLTRKLTMYIVTMYLPSMALVVLSWVSFWIDKKAVPARAGLTITTILAQITLITGTANKFPGIADLKLGDIYMIVNFFFVFGSLIEFAMISGTAGKPAAEGEKKPAPKWKRLVCADVDRTAKVLFPSTFLLWNVFYFCLGFGLRKDS